MLASVEILFVVFVVKQKKSTGIVSLLQSVGYDMAYMFACCIVRAELMPITMKKATVDQLKSNSTSTSEKARAH